MEAALEAIRKDLTAESKFLTLDGYIELLERLQEEISTRLNAARRDQERAVEVG